MAVWTRARRVALAIGLAAHGAGCGVEVTPTPILGTWYSDDARFEGRRLEIQQRFIRFMQEDRVLGVVQVHDVTQEGADEGPTRVEIEGIDGQGQATTLVFELQQRPKEVLHLETQRGAWRRGPRFVESWEAR